MVQNGKIEFESFTHSNFLHARCKRHDSLHSNPMSKQVMMNLQKKTKLIQNVIELLKKLHTYGIVEKDRDIVNFLENLQAQISDERPDCCHVKYIIISILCESSH